MRVLRCLQAKKISRDTGTEAVLADFADLRKKYALEIAYFQSRIQYALEIAYFQSRIQQAQK